MQVSRKHKKNPHNETDKLVSPRERERQRYQEGDKKVGTSMHGTSWNYFAFAAMDGSWGWGPEICWRLEFLRFLSLSFFGYRILGNCVNTLASELGPLRQYTIIYIYVCVYVYCGLTTKVGNWKDPTEFQCQKLFWSSWLPWSQWWRGSCQMLDGWCPSGHAPLMTWDVALLLRMITIVNFVIILAVNIIVIRRY